MKRDCGMCIEGHFKTRGSYRIDKQQGSIVQHKELYSGNEYIHTHTHV